MSASPTWDFSNPATLTLGWTCKCCNQFHQNGKDNDISMQCMLLDNGQVELRVVTGGHTRFSEAHTPIVWEKMAAEDLETIERNRQRMRRRRCAMISTSRG